MNSLDSGEVNTKAVTREGSLVKWLNYFKKVGLDPNAQNFGLKEPVSL